METKILLITLIFWLNYEVTESFKFQNKLSSFGQFATRTKIKIRYLHLAVPPPFTAVKGTEGFKEDPHGNLYCKLNC